MSGLGCEHGKARCRAIPSGDASKTRLGPGATGVDAVWQMQAAHTKGRRGPAEGGQAGWAPWAERAPERWRVPAPAQGASFREFARLRLLASDSALRRGQGRACCFLVGGSGGCAHCQLNPWAPFKAFHSSGSWPRGRNRDARGGGTTDIPRLCCCLKKGRLLEACVT